MNVLTVGKGFVADHLPYRNFFENGGRLSANLREVEAIIQNEIDNEKPDAIINTIGYCGEPNIDACESNKVRTYTANVTIPLILASVCEERSIRFIHTGSGCIFMGASPTEENFPMDLSGWKETDVANPQSYYSKTKYAADLALNGLSGVTILRIRMPISSQPSSRNIITKLTKYKEVIDEPNSMTFMTDFVRAIQHVLDEDLRGTYHVTSPGTFTAAQIMKEYQKYHPSHAFTTIGLDRLSELTVAPRSNCRLNAKKLESTGFVFEGSLENTMKEYCEVKGG